jgi:MFS family permease
MFVLSPLAGVAADRFRRRNVLIVTQAVVGLTAMVTAALIITGVIQVWHLFAVAFVQGAAFAFHMPARQALMAELVGPTDLANALALYNAGLNLNRVAGPAIGGALLTIPAVGAGGLFAIMAALYGIVLLALLQLPALSARTGQTVRVRGSAVDQLAVGLRYVATRPELRRLLLLAFLPVMFGMPYQSLMPATAASVFGVDAAGLGALMTANGLGALAGSLAVAGLGSGAHRLGRLQLTAGLLFGGGITAFALVGAFVPALGFVALAGGASSAYASVNNTLLMGRTAPEYHGRVMSVYMMTFAAMPLSSLPAAWAADLFGLPVTLAASGALTALVVALLGSPRQPAVGSR